MNEAVKRASDTLKMVALGLQHGAIKAPKVEMMLSDGPKVVPMLELVEAAIKGLADAARPAAPEKGGEALSVATDEQINELWELKVGTPATIAVRLFARALLALSVPAVQQEPTPDEGVHAQPYPEKCPITGRRYFMTLEHPELGLVPTYGGPFDSYTIPHAEGEPSQPWHERELACHHYDHDAGSWDMESVESVPLRIIHEDVLNDLLDAKEALSSPGGQQQSPANAVLERGKFHRFPADGDDPENFEWFASDITCDTCIDAVIVRADVWDRLVGSPGGAAAAAPIPADDAKDAQRYRWLRDKADYVREDAPQVLITDWTGTPVSTYRDAYPRDETLDRAIDAAMLSTIPEPSSTKGAIE